MLIQLSTIINDIKVGHVTCDNASNNRTMMTEFAVWLKVATGKEYDSKKRKLKCVGSTCPRTWWSWLLTNNSCLAHVINLATQMLISTYSKSPHFDPKHPDVHVPTSRDEVGLIRAIAVKVRCCFAQERISSLIIEPRSGTLVIKAKRDVDDYSD